MKKVLIIVLIALVLAGGIGFGVYWFFIREKPEVVAFYQPGEYFVTNVQDSTRLCKITIILQLNDDGQEEYLTTNNHILRDVIISVMREQTIDELEAVDGPEVLKNDIMAALQSQMGMDYLVDIYYNDFIIQ